jgi:hypothetical protein
MTAFSTVIEDVYDALTHVTTGVGVSVSADIRQKGELIPAVVYTMDSADFTRYAGGSMAPVHCTFRFDCLHDSRLEAETLAADVETALAASSLVVSRESESTDLFSRGADVEPVYVSSLSYIITCGTL